MGKMITLFLGTAPYMSENTVTAIKLAESALKQGHTVNLIASGDGIYNFLKSQKAKGLMNAEEEFSRLIEAGLHVSL